jgi:hypothetical protein
VVKAESDEEPDETVQVAVEENMQWLQIKTFHL